MSCLRIRILSPRKAWKSFASKFSMLHKFRKSKAIKKPDRDRFNPTPFKIATHSQLLDKHFRGKRKIVKKSQKATSKFRLHLRKKDVSVYVDNLFKEPVNEGVARLRPQSTYFHTPESKKLNLFHEPVETPGTSMVQGMEIRPSPDDIWESAGLTSPLMHRIDDRAEQFIARFRAELEAQEKLERNL